ncbi:MULTISPECIES: hypothetical protein [unclassified Nonomuraea]
MTTIVRDGQQRLDPLPGFIGQLATPYRDRSFNRTGADHLSGTV